MRKDIIFSAAANVAKKFSSPFDLLDSLGAVTVLSDKYSPDGLKGYCYFPKRTMFVVINAKLSEAEQRIVAAHEAAHVILHKDHLKIAPMRDFYLYDMKNRLEYEANMFAADFLISDEQVRELTEDWDYFSMCKKLAVSPDLMSFKLFSMTSRGYPYTLPQNLNSTFLK